MSSPFADRYLAEIRLDRPLVALKEASMQEIYTRPAHVITRRVGDEIIALDMDSELYFSLNEVGAQMYDLLCEGKSVGDVVVSMSSKYNVTDDRLAADLDALIHQLVGRGLLTPAS